MLNFRYHVVSLVAVFLALAIGVIMGSTVIDRAVVDRLQSGQERLREEITDVRAENASLGEALIQSEEGVRQVGAHVAAGTLADTPVVVLGRQGVEPEGWEELVGLIDGSGAERRGAYRVTDRLAARTSEDRTALAEVLGERRDEPSDELRDSALTVIADEIRAAAAVPTGDPVGDDAAAGADPAGATTAEPTPTIDALVEGGFLAYESSGLVPVEEPVIVPGTRVLLVVGPGGGAEALHQLAGELVDEGVPAPAPVVAVEAPGAVDDGEPRPDPGVVGRLRNDEAVVERIATVDNVDQRVGRLATVLALAAADELGEGHYGVGEGSSALVPEPPSGATDG